MKVFFIRHSKAVDRSSWLQDDMRRPLSDGGLSVAKKIFKSFLKLYDRPEIVYTSEALRAKESAEIFCKYSKTSKLITEPLLNPGFNMSKFNEIINNNKQIESIALFGHEPDFSGVISTLLGCGSVSVEMKKCSIAEVDIDNGKPMLIALIPPRILI